MKNMAAFVLTGLALLSVSLPSQAADPVDIPFDEPVAVEDTGWYLSVFAGGAWPGFADFTYDGDDEISEIGTLAGWTAGVALGTRLTDMARVEIEFSHVSQEYDVVYEPNGDPNDYGGKIDATYMLGNVWLDFDTGSAFTPYVGAGLGGALVSLDDVDGWFDSASVWDGFGVAYQVGAGVMFEVSENVSLDLGYRFKGVAGAQIDNLDAPNTNTSDSCCLAELSLGNHVVQVGATVGF